MLLLKSFIFCAILTGVISGPAGGRGTSKCVSFCKESTKFAYTPGTTYNYDYTTDISTFVIGGSNHESRIHLKARAEISAVTSCELVLKLRNVEIEESEPDNTRSRRPIQGSQALAQELTRFPLRFSFQDGKIEHVCSADQESTWVLNIKRGVLSTLQNTMENLDTQQSINEVDVSGRCLTVYEPSGNSRGGGVTLQKTKDLTGCSHRPSQITALQSIPYTSSSPIQSIPLLKGKQECSQTIRNGRVEKVQCEEVHKFQPFEGESGAQTVVTQTLVYSSEVQQTVGDETMKMKKLSLLFQSQLPSEASETDIGQIVSILDKLEHESVPEIRAETPHHFIKLVENLRVINHGALKALFKRTKSPVAKKYLIDAMPLVSSASSLAFMRDLLFDGTLDDKHADNWLTSLAFIKNPTLDMISALTPLLNEEPRNQGLLGISSMINSYCKTFTSCTEQPSIQTVLEKIYSYLGNDCRVSDPEQRKRILFTLKAIGNAGRFPSAQGEVKGYSVLTRCLVDRNNPTEIRLAAIDSFRRMPCRQYERNQILSIFANMHEDTEVRIKAYLISMKCADRQLIDTVKDTLYTDSVNQVVSFVWTHLTNLQETSSPDKQAIRELLSNDFLKNKFNTDARKYSRNYEGSLYWQELNVGGSSDSNLIFTPDSFLPRSGAVNLTVHLFGESVNVLEFGARVKSLEQLLEPIFGPNGYFPDQSVTEALHSMRRSKRDVTNNALERLHSIYNQAVKKQDSPRGSIYTRIFGHEILYKNFDLSNGNNEPAFVDEDGHDWMDMDRILNSLTNGDQVEYTKSTVLLDATYTVTTSAGIPLSLAVKSAATVGLVANGKIDFGKAWELDIKGVVQPSAAVQVDGTLFTQLGTSTSPIKAGVILQNTLHTSTSIQGEVTLRGSRVIRSSLSVPQEKQEIFKASSQILILRPSGEEHTIEQGPSGIPKIQHQFCSPSNADLLGVQLCGEINVPDHFTFPLITPAQVAIYLQKTDTFQAYQFDYSFTRDGAETAVNVIFDTPGSRINRRLAANFQLDTFNGILDASIDAPGTSVRAEGKYSASQKTLQLTLSALEQEILMVNAAFKQQGSRIEPNLLIKFYSRPLIALDGVVDLMNVGDDNGKASFNIILKHLTQNPVRVNGELNRSGEKYDTKLEIESYLLTGVTRSQFRLRPGHFSTKSVTEYSWKNAPVRNVDVSAKVQSTKKGQLTRFSSQFNFAVSDSPDTNVDFSWETKKSVGFLENSMKFTLGKSSWTGHTLYNKQMTKDQQELNLQASLSAPKHEIDYHVELSHRLNEQGMTSKLLGRMSPQNEVKAEIEFLEESDSLIKKSLTAKVNWPGSEYSLRSTLNEIREGNFEGEIIFLTNQANEMKATIIYKNGSTNKKLDHLIEFRARGLMAVPITGNAAFSASDKQSHLSCQLEIEGRENYSGRWSTSLDYGIIKTNTRKLEGKLTLNDRKYTGEVTYRKTKSGERNLLVDLNAGNHITIETMLKGDFPGPFDYSFAYHPDKDSQPDNKFGFDGTLDSRSILLNIDYYGQQIVSAASYRDAQFQLECQLWDNQRYALSVSTPQLTARNFIITATLATPIDGFRDLTFAIRHTSTGHNFNCEFQGQLDQFATNVKLSAFTQSDECRLGASFEASGMRSVQVFGRLIHTSDEKGLELTTKYGEQQRVLKGGLKYLKYGFNYHFETTGCNYIPEIKVDLEHQFHNQLKTDLQIEWVPHKSSRRQIQFQVTGQKSPFNYKFFLNSPWEKLNGLLGKIDFSQERGTKEFVMSLDGNYELLPVSLTTRCAGTNKNFQHEVILAWKDQNVKLTSEGRYMSFLDAAVTTKLTLPGHNFQLILTNEKDGKLQKVQLDASHNRHHYTGGLSWTAQSSLKDIEASIWYQYSGRPRFTLEFQHVRKAGQFKIHALASNGEKILIKYTTDLQSTGFQQWNFITIVDSSMDSLPTLKMVSIHSIQNGGEDIEHKSEILVGKTQAMRRLWDHSVSENDVHKALAQFNLKGGRHFDGLVSVNENKIELRGEFQKTSSEKKLQLQLTSTLFNPIQVEGALKNSHHQYEASVSTSSNGNSLFAVKIEGGRKEEKIIGSLDFDCSFGHHVTGSIVLNTQQNKLDLSLKEDRANLIDLKISGQAMPTEGYTKLSIQSGLLSILEDKVKLEMNYKFDHQLEFSAKYHRNEDVRMLTGSGAWTDEKKGVELKYEGGNRMDRFQLEILDMNRLNGLLIVNNESIFEVTAQHSYEKSDYAFGKHTIKILAKTDQSYEITTTFGLDLNKILFTIETPIEGWTKLSLIGQFNLEGPKKSLTLTAAREQEQYILNSEGHVSQEDGKILISIQTPIEGFTSMGLKLSYKNKNTVGGELVVKLESQQYSIKGQLSSSGVDGQLETPIEIVRHVKFVGQWELTDTTKKSILVKAEYNNDAYELKGNLNMEDPLKGVGQLGFKGGKDVYNVQLNYDLTQEYSANLLVSTSESQHNIGGKVALNKEGIEIEIKTPFTGYENIRGKAIYNKKSGNHHQALLQWNLNGESGQFKLDATVQDGEIKIKLETPFEDYDKINVIIAYQPEGSEKLISIQGSLGEGKPIKLSVGTKLEGNLYQLDSPAKASITIDIQIPLENVETFYLHTEYKRGRSGHDLTVSARKNEETLTGSLSGQLSQTNDVFQIKLTADLTAPSFGVNKLDASSTIRHSQNGQSSFVAEADFNNEKHKIEANYEGTPSSLNFQAKTTFKEVRNLGLTGEFDNSNGRFQASFQLNEQQTTVQGQYIFNGVRHSKINIKFTSPFHGFKTIQADAEVRLGPSSLLTILTFQNEIVRYGGKLEGTFENRRSFIGVLPESLDVKLSLNSPIYHYENIVSSLKYSLKQQPRIQLSMIRNTREEIKGEFSLHDGELKFNLMSNLENYPIDTRNLINWNSNPLSVNVLIDAGPTQYRGSVKVNIQGLRLGEVSIESSIPEWEKFKVEWKIEGNRLAGGILGSINLGALGHNSYRSTWRTTEDWDTARFEFWAKSHGQENEQGFSTQYSMNVGGKTGSGKLAASLQYILGQQKQQLTFSTSIKRSSHSSTLDITLQTPFGLVQEAALNGKIVLGQDISVDVTASLNKEIQLQTSVILSVNQLASKFKWSFIAPAVGQPFNLNAGYDLRTVQKFVELTFVQNEYQMNIRADATVPQDSNEIELHMNVNSNVPLIQVSASGSLKAGYKIDSDETRHLSISVNSEDIGKWQVTGGLRLTSDFYAKLHISTPRPDIIPNLKSEINYTGNLRQGISSQASIQIDRHPELKSILTVSKDKIFASFNSGIPGFENLALEAKFESGTGFAHKKFLIDIQAMGEQVSLEGKLNIPAHNSMEAQGSLTLNSTWDKINNGNLQLNVERDGNIQITGTWDQQQVAIRGKLNTHRHVPWWKAGSTEFSLESNSEEKVRIKTSHVLSDKEYSFNFTLGENYSIQSYVNIDMDKVLSTTIQWASDQIVKVFAEAGSGRFTASLESPWTSPMRANGMYTLTSTEQSANGQFTYDGQRSSLQAQIQTKNGGFSSSLNVDIPSLHQKLDANVVVKKIRENVWEGSVDMNMGDRRLAIHGQVTENEKTVRGHKMIDRVVKLTLNLPSESYPRVTGEVTIQRSKANLASLEVEASISLPSGTSKAAFGYEIPINNDNQIGVRAMIDSPLVSEKPLEFIFSTEIVTARNFKAKFQYEDNDVQLTWDSTLPQVRVEGLLNVPILWPSHNPFKFHLDGHFDLPQEIRLKMSASCSQHMGSLEGSYSMQGNTINSRISIDMPTILSGKNHEIRLKLDKDERAGRYILDVTTVLGDNVKTVGFESEVIVQPQLFSVSGKTTGYFGNHFLQLAAKKGEEYWQELEINGESISILKGKKFNSITKLQRTIQGFEVEVECQTRKTRHLAKVTVNIGKDGLSGQISGKFESPTFKPITTTVEWSADEKAVKGKIVAIVQGERHQIEANLNIEDLAARLYMECFLIPGKEFNLQTKAIVRTNDFDVLADAKVNGAQWRLEGTTRYNNARDMEAKLEIRTPFADWERFTIGGKLTSNEIHAELYTPFKSFPNAMFTLSGLPLDFDNFSLGNIQPLVIVGLPWVTYAASATCKLPLKGNPGEFRISFEERLPKQSAGKRYEASLRIPSWQDLSLRMTNPVKVHFEASIPGGRRVRTIRWEIGGRLQWKTWAELNAFGELNGEKIEFVSEVRNEQGNRRLSIELNTPFPEYERFIASIRLENYHKIGTGQNIFVEFQRPTWEHPMKIEIDYHYRFRGLVDMDGELNIVAPRFFIDFPPLALRGQSKVNEGIYNGRVEGSWGQHRPSLIVEAGMTPDRLYAIMEGKLSPSMSQNQGKISFELTRQDYDFGGQFQVEWEEEIIILTKLTVSHPSDMIDVDFAIKTPFEIIRTASAGVRISPLGLKESFVQQILNNLHVSLGATYNSKKIIQIELVSVKGKRSIDIHNPLRPVSLTLSYEHVPGQKIKIKTEVCWNLKKALESTAGVELFLVQTSATRNAAFKIQGGQWGLIELLTSQVFTAVKMESEAKIRWQSSSQPDIQELGYIVMFNDESTSRSVEKYDFLAQLDTPLRSIQVKADLSSTDKEWNRFAELKWDVKRDGTKRIGFKCQKEKISGWKSETIKSTYTVIHSALPHSLTLVLEKTLKSEGMDGTLISIQTTPYPKDYLTIGISGMTVDGQGILFTLTHPASNLNVQIIAQRTRVNSGITISYMDVRGETHLAQVTLSYDESTALFEITTGKELTSVFRIERINEQNRTWLSLRGLGTVEVSIYKDRPFVDLTLEYDSVKRLHFTAGLPHKKELSLKLWRDEYGMTIQDVLVILRLNTSQILSSRLNWRPEILDDAYDFVTVVAPRTLRNSLEVTWVNLGNNVSEELQGRWNMLQPDVKRTLETLGSFTVAEIQYIGQEIGKIGQFLSHLYDNNSFYLKDVAKFIGGYFEGLLQVCAEICNIVVDAGTVTMRLVVDSSVQLFELVKVYAGELENLIIPLWNDAEKFVERMWKEQFKVLSDFVDLVEASYDTLMDAVEGRIEQLEKKILAIGFVRKAIRFYQDYTTWIEELPLQEYIEEICDMLDEFVWQPLKVYYEPYYNAITTAMEEKNLLAILELPPLPYLRFVGSNAKSICTRFWGFIKAEQQIKILVTKILQSLDSLVHRNIPQYTLIWDTDKRHIEYHQPLTIFEWEDFTTLPKLKKTEEDQQDINKMNDFYYQVVDTVRNVKPAFDLNIRDILPPFGAHAVMAGDHHYYTFDKKYFRFAGECSYVLAADLLHQNFSLIVNYENRDGDIRKKSYTLVAGRNSIDIDTSTMKVTLDGRKTELPLEVGPTFIRRMPNGVEIFDSRGFQMTCNQSPAVCTLSISGWYFGKVAGLLGTYDNEEMNDMRTPDGEIVTDVANFAHSWRVGKNSGECRMKNLARDSQGITDADGVCSQIFDDKRSLLRPCFNRVDTTVFSEMCRYDTSHNLNKVSRTESACTAISAYVTECQKNGVDVWLPPGCIRCNLEDGTTLMSGENATLRVNDDERQQKSTDVIILLEESSCISPNNGLTDAMRQLDNTLKLQGLQENRYALIGFGGQGPHRKPHIHTSSGQIWAHSTLFRVPDTIEMTGDGRGDLYEALEFASSTLKFRAGVSKTIIAVTCGDERCGSENRYSDALTLLLENDFTLHLLTQKEFTLKGNKKDGVTSKVFGIDLEGAYTSAHIRNTEADKSLKRQINLPKDHCTPLAIETNGTRFSLQRSSKKFLDVWSRRVAKTASPSDCQHCECVPDKSGSPHVVCSPCVSPNLRKMFEEWQKYETLDRTTDDENLPIEVINQL